MLAGLAPTSLVFGAGTLVGMTAITTGLALRVAVLTHQWRGGERMLRLATGGVSLAMGMWLVFHIGWSDGLFLASST